MDDATFTMRMLRGDALFARWCMAPVAMLRSGIKIYTSRFVQQNGDDYLAISPKELSDNERSELYNNIFSTYSVDSAAVPPALFDVYCSLDAVEEIEWENPAIVKDGRDRVENAACDAHGTEADEQLHAKRKGSYLKVIAALCAKSRALDIGSRDAASTIKAEIEKIGLFLGEDTIRTICKEVQDIMSERKTK